jgi:predicted amidohydrolase
MMVKVTAAQIKITNNPKINLGRMLLYIRKAKADIICFPEKSLITNKNKRVIKKIPFNNYLKEIKEACRRKRIHCVFGTYYLEENNVFNAAFLVDDKGKVLYKYKKVNLFVKEKNIKAGTSSRIIKTRFGPIAAIICWDISHPEFVKRLNKAWIIFCPSYIKNYGREMESYLQMPYVRAFENSCYFVVADSANRECASYSMICSPSKIIKKIKGKEGSITANLNKEKILRLRKYYKLK